MEIEGQGEWAKAPDNTSIVVSRPHLTLVIPAKFDTARFQFSYRHLRSTCNIYIYIYYRPITCLGLALYTRLQNEGFPHRRLSMYYRITPTSSAFPNKRIYREALKNAQLTATRPRDQKFDDFLVSYLLILVNIDSQLVCVKMADGTCEEEMNTGSFNEINVNVLDSSLARYWR